MRALAKGVEEGILGCLALPERLLLVAVGYRTNLTMRQLAPLFGVCPEHIAQDPTGDHHYHEDDRGQHQRC